MSLVYTHREIVTIDDPQRLVLKEPLPLRKGQRVEVLIVAEGEDADLERLRGEIAQRGVTEADVKDAVAWARGGRNAGRIRNGAVPFQIETPAQYAKRF